MLKIKRPIYEVLHRHVEYYYPLEACGFLVGNDGTVDTLYVIENWLHSRTTYEMDPTQQINAMIDIEESGFNTFIIYHSHPDSPAYPSETDLARAYYPDAIYAIVSLENAQPQMRVFRIQSDGIDEIFWQLV